MSSALGVPLTLFAIGENLERPESAAKLRAMASADTRSRTTPLAIATA